MSFFHRQFGEIARTVFLDAGLNEVLHGRLASYFAQQAYRHGSGAGVLPNFRKSSELAYQLMKGAMLDELQETLNDFSFPLTKCMTGALRDLVADYPILVDRPTSYAPCFLPTLGRPHAVTLHFAL